jgi:hypothetical protein
MQRSELIGSRTQETAWPKVEISQETTDWNPENFCREQIRSLVQRVFFAQASGPVKQVVFTAVGPNPDVTNICDQVGRALAFETRADVAIVGRKDCAEEIAAPSLRSVARGAIKSWSTRVAINLWHVPDFGPRPSGEKSGTGPYWLSCLAELRNEFEYSVIQAPAAGISSEAALLGQLADGIILVLGAHSTRKATARKIKETLEGAQSRILGMVLSERRFPVPERIYRRL